MIRVNQADKDCKLCHVIVGLTINCKPSSLSADEAISLKLVVNCMLRLYFNQAQDHVLVKLGTALEKDV